MLVTGATAHRYPKLKDELWDFTTLLKVWPPAVSLAVAILLTISLMSHNLAANVVSPANDIANLFPRWIDFRKGAILSICIASCLMPWRILASPGGYLRSFVLGYSMFTGGLLGVLLADFFVLRKRSLDIEQLYVSGREGIYHYTRMGFNPCGFAALALGCSPCIPGLVARLVTASGAQATWLPVVLERVYAMSWFVSLAISGPVYLMLARCSPSMRASLSVGGGFQPMRVGT